MSRVIILIVPSLAKKESQYNAPPSLYQPKTGVCSSGNTTHALVIWGLHASASISALAWGRLKRGVGQSGTGDGAAICAVTEGIPGGCFACIPEDTEGCGGSGDDSLLNGGTALVKERCDLSSVTSLNTSSLGSPSREGSPDPDAFEGFMLPNYTKAQSLSN